ncbi:hypothetical protein FMUND_5947 [Fusarium mundagurra]|uniref:Uncharacterized protein n=1 Tax=Fusarium mundagurra TaxID=1567541 RepID=A0A8H5YRB0_9HYPO|nr:hypothetical protein FMUND_5947 [Fusarium mundagurra]
MPGATGNTKERTADPSIEVNKAAETYLRFLQDEIQRLKDEEDRDRWILELVEQNELLEKEIQRLAEQIKKLSPEKEQETEK